jgi:hypothetical protein
MLFPPSLTASLPASFPSLTFLLSSLLSRRYQVLSNSTTRRQLTNWSVASFDLFLSDLELHPGPQHDIIVTVTIDLIKGCVQVLLDERCEADVVGRCDFDAKYRDTLGGISWETQVGVAGWIDARLSPQVALKKYRNG